MDQAFASAEWKGEGRRGPAANRVGLGETAGGGRRRTSSSAATGSTLGWPWLQSWVANLYRESEDV